jgi:serine/threonine protein kinase
MPLPENAVFAGYTVIHQLGSGGMGEVYLVQHPRLPRRDALKVLPPSLTQDTEFRQRFTREAELAATLFHPNIVGMHDRGEYDGQLWMSMDYIDGTDAAHMVRERYPTGMPLDEALGIAVAVADALDHAHERGLLHRDVKPANILLAQPDGTGQRRVFLADFGIARPLADPGGLTATNLTVGTVAYAAPEQLAGEDLDARADQYALAASVFHLMTGAPPFDKSNPVAVISAHLSAPPPQIGGTRPELAQLDEVFSTALAKDPAQRFASCRDFAAALVERAGVDPHLGAAETQLAIPPVSRGSSSKADGEGPKRKRAAFAAAAAAAVLILVLVVVVGANMWSGRTGSKESKVDGGRGGAIAASPNQESRSLATAAEGSAYKVEIVSFTQIDSNLNVRIRNPNNDVGLVRSPFELALIDDAGAVIATEGQSGFPGASCCTIYQLPPGGEFGLRFIALPPGKKVASLELTILGEWLQWDSVDSASVALTDVAMGTDSGFSGPSVTGRFTLDRHGPLNIVLVAFIKTSAGTVLSTKIVDCAQTGQRRAFETESFDNVRGPYELESIVAYPTSVKGAGPQYVPSC